MDLRVPLRRTRARRAVGRTRSRARRGVRGSRAGFVGVLCALLSACGGDSPTGPAPASQDLSPLAHHAEDPFVQLLPRLLRAGAAAGALRAALESLGEAAADGDLVESRASISRVRSALTAYAARGEFDPADAPVLETIELTTLEAEILLDSVALEAGR
jgi:hypothetical protein